MEPILTQARGREGKMREVKSLAYGDGIWTWVSALP